MHTQTLDQFHIIGISVRTTNANNQSMIDIPALWQQFMENGILEKIPNKIDTAIYCMYTDYEKDHTTPYTTVLGCRVHNLDNIPDGMIGKTIPTASYEKITVKGNLLKGAVYSAWQEIWNSNIPRVFTADFEVYGEKAANPEDAELDIFIAI